MGNGVQGQHHVSCVIHFYVVSALRIHISVWSMTVCEVSESVLGSPPALMSMLSKYAEL